MIYQNVFFLLQLCHITGSTAQVYLEYIERNLPEGVAMEVTKVGLWSQSHTLHFK